MPRRRDRGVKGEEGDPSQQKTDGPARLAMGRKRTQLDGQSGLRPRFSFLTLRPRFRFRVRLFLQLDLLAGHEALGQELIRAGRKVYFCTCCLFVQESMVAKRDLKLSKVLKRLRK
jgi:hypothetical protein